MKTFKKVMSYAANKTDKKQPGKAVTYYHGVRIQSIGGGSRFTRDQLRQAVANAIAKNADAFASGR